MQTMNNALRMVAQCGVRRSGLLALILLLPFACAAAPIIRSLEFTGTFSNTVFYPVEPWMNTNTVNLTVETWVYPRRLENLQALVARAHATNLWFGLSSNRLRFARSGGHWVESTGTVPLRRWTHVAATYDGTMARFYIDGTLAGSQALLSAGNDCTNSLSVGGQRDVTSLPDIFAAGYAFDGYLDEVRLWTTARSGAEISANMDLEVRSGAGLLAAFGNGGAYEDLRELWGTPVDYQFYDRLRGFGLLPATLSIPWTSAGLTLDGVINPALEYNGAETIVLRSATSPTAWDQPAYLIVSTNATNHHLFIGVPGLPVGSGGSTPVVQIRGARDETSGANFALGDWECRLSESGLASGTTYRTDAFVPVPTWRTWPMSSSNWQAATVLNEEFLRNYEFRVHASHLDRFTNSVRMLARYYQYDSSGDQLVFPRDGAGANPATFATVNWGREAYAPRQPRTIFGSVTNVARTAGVPGLVVSMYSGDSELTGVFLASTLTDTNGHFAVSHPSVPEDQKVTVTYAPPGGYVTYLDPIPATTGTGSGSPLPVSATNSPYSVTYPEGIPGYAYDYYLAVHFRLAAAAPVAIGAVTPTNLPATVVLRTSPSKATPTNTFTLAGTNLHAGLQLYFKAPGCAADPPWPCLGTPNFVPAHIVSIAPDGLSLVAEVPSELAGNADLTRTFQLVVYNPDWRVDGVGPWFSGPSVTLTPPIWPALHGFEFKNEDDGPSVAEFEACYGDSIFAPVPFPPFLIRDPHYGFWGAVYLIWMGGAEGSCFGMAGTSRLIQEGTIPPGMFDTAGSGVLRGNGFPGLGTNHLGAPKPAHFSGFDLYQPYRPLNLWGQITSLAGAQTSGEELGAWLAQVRRPVAFGTARGLAQGNPTNVLNLVRSAPGEFTICIYQRDWGKGHCVTPYAVADNMGLMEDGLTPTNAANFSLIRVYDNNHPEEESLIEVDRTQNLYRYNGEGFPLEDMERDGYLGRGLFSTPMSVYRNARHAPGPDFLAEHGVDYLRLLLVGASSASVTNAAGESAGWTSDGLSNSYTGALPYVPVGYVPGASNRWDTTMFFLPTSNAPAGGSFSSRGSNVLVYGALGWSDIAFGFRAPSTGPGNSVYGILISSNQALQGMGVRSANAVEGFSAMLSVRDTAGQSRVWLLDAGAGAVSPEVHLSHEGFSALRVRNHGATPLNYRVNLAGVDAGRGAFEFASEWLAHPPGAILTLRPVLGTRPGFTRELDFDADGTPELIETIPARGALRAGREGGLLALRWRPGASTETLEATDDLTNPSWLATGTTITNDGPDRVAHVPMSNPAQFFRVRPVETNCYSLAAHALGPKPNPWETNGFKFEAFNGFGAAQPFNSIVTRSGSTGLDVAHTVHIHPQDDCQVMHLDVRQTSGLVFFEAVGPLGSVVSRQELRAPGTGPERVTLRVTSGRIHFVRVISPNALCLIENVCTERTAQPQPIQFPPSCLNFENMEPDFLNSPAQFGLLEITPAQGPVVIEPVPDLGVNGVQMAGNVTIQVNFSFGTCRRVTLRLRDSVGGALIQAYDFSGFTWLDAANTVASPDPQTIVLDGPGISQIRFTVPHSELHLLEFCCERDLFQ